MIVLVLTFAFLVLRWLSRPQKPEQNYDDFAKCLASKQLTMFGAYWCSHCQNEKKAFGDSFKYVPYVECTQETQKCIDAGVQSYPTWITADGQKYVGEQGLSGLSKISSCPLL